ncbi:DMT family transporter [Cryptosporangium aurantiacum]|uniref:Permease of the drug/metabolite transporter (DMT) superfamily n=1 Tax=Cryptosporangium aurantiacum TaxID=134849 RepID=A0A1M7RBA0_9ACTN|nr:DMT family transporter [Cryptosporangium aurantiacum]SHN43567.1 Permease of the drug/metabolite transporter (DMT) superfamily [Cryptosporangium aurantiacum]
MTATTQPRADQTTTNLRTLGAVSFTVAAWASAFIGIRWVGEHYTAGPLAFGRLLVGTLALGAALAATRRWVPPTRREWALILLCGIAWFGIYNVALNDAERRVDAGTAAMLVNLGPILIALFAGLLLREGFPRWLLIGAAVAFTGVILIGVPSARQSDADALGVALCLVAAVTYAIGVLAQKPTLRRLPALQVTWLACTIGTLTCVPYAPGFARELTDSPTGATAGLVYLGLVPTALAFGTWAYALSRMDAGRLGITTYVVPPLAVLGGWALLGETPAALALVGGAVCLAGVALSRRREKVSAA